MFFYVFCSIMKCYQKSLLLVFSCLWFAPFLHAQEEVDVNDMNKRELRRFATQQLKTEDSLKQAINQFEQDIASKNAFIDQSRATIADLNAKLESAQTKIKELEQRLIGLEEKANNNALLLEESQKTNTGLTDQIVTLKDSILYYKKVGMIIYDSLTTLQNQTLSGSSEVTKIGTGKDFLNQLYLGKTTLNNQSFVLVPRAVMGVMQLERAKLFDDNYYYNNDYYNNYNNQDPRRQFFKEDNYDDYKKHVYMDAFYPMQDLNVGVQNQMKKKIPNPTILKNYKKLIEANYKVVSGNNYLNYNNNPFPKLSFLKGKLMTIQSGDESHDYLFSLAKNQSGSKNKIGQKGYFFNLTDDDEVEYKLNLMVWQNELYLVLTMEELDKLNLPFLFSNTYHTTIRRECPDASYESDQVKEVKHEDDSYRVNYLLDNNRFEVGCNYYTYCDRTYISLFTKENSFQNSTYINPVFIFCKLQTLE